MKRNARKIISLLLLFAMTVGYLPANAFSLESENASLGTVVDIQQDSSGFSYVVLDPEDPSPRKPDGSGTKEDPYEITDANELLWIPEQVNGGKDFRGEYISLGNHIDLSGALWEPVGAYEENPFSGTFYGNGHEVKNLRVAIQDKRIGADCHYIGFFGYVKDADIQDLGLADFSSEETYSENTVIGGFSAYAENSQITNCYAKGDMEAVYSDIAPLEKPNMRTIAPVSVSELETELNDRNEYGQTVILDLSELDATTINKTIRIGRDISYLRVIGAPGKTYTGLSFVLSESSFHICIELVDLSFTARSGEYALSGDGFANTVYLRSNGSGNSIQGASQYDAINLPNANVYICGTADLTVTGGHGVDGADGTDGQNGGNGRHADGDHEETAGKPGNPGTAGGNGTDGARGIYAASLHLNTSATVSVTSGNGGNGGNGGKGGNGGRGGDSLWHMFRPTTWDNGANGGDGGAGGNGGSGGKTNYAIELDQALTLENGELFVKTGANGNGGKGGNGGNGGRGGDASSDDKSGGDGGDAGLNGKGGDAYKLCNAISENTSVTAYNRARIICDLGNGSGTVGEAGTVGGVGQGGSFVGGFASWGYSGDPGSPVKTPQTAGTLLYGVTAEGIPIDSSYGDEDTVYDREYVIAKAADLPDTLSGSKIKLNFQSDLAGLDRVVTVASDVDMISIERRISGLSFVLAARSKPITIALYDAVITGCSGTPVISGDFTGTAFIESHGNGNRLTGGSGGDAIYLPNAAVVLSGDADLDIFGGDGKDGAAGKNGKAGSRASGNGKKGGSGTSGENGGNGQDAGRGIVADSLTVNIPDSAITIRSGSGGDGGDGGNGGNGARGGDSLWNMFDSSTWGDGGSGGHGGNGGDGGNGGRSSYAISVSNMKIESGNCLVRSGDNGSGGRGGNGGNGGRGGDASSDAKTGGRGGNAGVNGRGGNAYYACNAIDERLSMEVIQVTGGSLDVSYGERGEPGNAGAAGSRGGAGKFVGGALSWGYDGKPGSPATGLKENGVLQYGVTDAHTELETYSCAGDQSGPDENDAVVDFDKFEHLSKATLYIGGFVGQVDEDSVIHYCSSINSSPDVLTNSGPAQIGSFVTCSNALNTIHAGNFVGENNGSITDCLAAYVSQNRGEDGYAVSLYSDGYAAINGSGAVMQILDAALIDTQTNQDQYGIVYGVQYHEDDSLLKDFVAERMTPGAEEIIIWDDAFDGRFIGKITMIDRSAFQDTAFLRKVLLANSTITVIPENAFYNCGHLQEVVLSDYIERIEDRAFYDCRALTEFTIPDGVVSVGEAILGNCNEITVVSIGSGLRSFKDHDGYRLVYGEEVPIEQPLFGFSKSESQLQKYVVDDGNPYFSSDGYGVLYRKIDLLPEPNEVSVVDAPAGAKMAGYELPAHIVKIEAYAFSHNHTITQVNLDYFRMIGVSAFEACTGLRSVSLKSEANAALDAAIGSTISYNQYIDDRAFRGCTNLGTAFIEADAIIGIGEEAFYGCSELTDVKLGRNVQVIGLRAFSADAGSSKLEQFFVDENNPYFMSIEGILYQVMPDGNLKLKQYPACLTCVDENGNEIAVTEFALPVTDDNGQPVCVSAIDSYAFQGTESLQKVTIGKFDGTDHNAPSVTIGDYAFYYAKNLTQANIGSNVKSVGTNRDVGEYSVFAECTALESINVDGQNGYYSSEDGVFFNKGQTKLLKYPAGKLGSGYVVPDTVNIIGAMAFKHNTKLNTVTFRSYVSVIGMEAFYHCSSLAVIFFDDVYAPRAIMENAFNTYYSSKDGVSTVETIIGYGDAKFSDGINAGEIGWNTYSDTYNLQSMDELPKVTVGQSNDDFYAIVIVDTNGERIYSTTDKDGNEWPLVVSLTDPNGNTETVETGKPTAGVLDGAAVFYNLYGNVNLGFSVEYDRPYQLRIMDPSGEYFSFTSDEFFLDYDMRLSYITMSKQPRIFGLNCNERDINTQTVVLNKAEYGDRYSVKLKDSAGGYTEDNVIYENAGPETVTVSTIILYDEAVQRLEPASLMLYQNGRQIPGCTVQSLAHSEDSATVVFEFAAEDLIPETPIEARFQVTGQGGKVQGSAFLNIDVIDFVITEEDINLDAEDISVDLTAGGAALASLFGSETLNFNLGENLKFDIAVEDDRITASLNAAYSKSKTKSKDYGTNYQEGYKNNIQGHHGNTWRFDRYFSLVDSDYSWKNYKMNIWFARGTEAFGYYYYRCSVYEVGSEDQEALFFGVVNAVGGRAGCSKKASLVSAAYAASALLEQDASKGHQYVEPILKGTHGGSVSASTKNSFEATLYGDIVFQYQKGGGLVPVNSEIKGELKYVFEHDRQFVVWIIPIHVAVKVDVGGNVNISLKYDEWKSVSVEEAKMTVQAELTARAGVGCSVLSAGVTGNIGTVFVMHFAPKFGVESWEVHGGLGLYATYFTLKWKQGWLGIWYPSFEEETAKKDIYSFSGYIIDNRSRFNKGETESGQMTLTALSAPLFLADAYEAAKPEEYSENAELFVSGDTIYKLGFVNMCSQIRVPGESDQPVYDEYNYLKLALFAWDAEQRAWNRIRVLEDNGYNDFAYDIYQNTRDTYFIFTQQTEKSDLEMVSDSYDYVSDLAVKCISLEDVLNDAKASTVCTGRDYKYLSTVADVNGELVAVWAENADNNIFGVSKDNYVDESGNIHVFETNSNSIWTSRLDAQSGQWQEPVCIKAGLSAVTELEVTDSGYIAFIVDENGNLADIDDRMLYTVNIKNGNTLIVTEADGEYATSVKTMGKDLIYGSVVDEESRLTALDLDKSGNTYALPDSMSEATDVFSMVTDRSGNIRAVLYVENATWEENGTTVSGGELYGIFHDGASWGKPVAISTDSICRSKDRYIASYSAVLSDGQLLIEAEYVDGTGAAGFTVTDCCPLEAACTLEAYEMSYVEQTLYVTVKNSGAAPTGLYAMVNGTPRTLTTMLASGAAACYSIDLSGCRGDAVVSVHDSISSAMIAEPITVSTTFSNLTPCVKQLLLGEQNKLLVSVKNTGNIPDSGNLYVAVGGKTVEEIREAADVFSVGTVSPSQRIYLEIPLEKGIAVDENTIITMYVESLGGVELGDAADDNILHMTAQAFSAAVTDYEPELGLYGARYDKKDRLNMEIPFYCADGDSVETVSCGGALLALGADYSISGNKIVIESKFLDGLPAGTHSVVVSFAGGHTETVTITVVDCFDVRWINDDGSLIKELTDVAGGTIPVCTVEPAKEPSEESAYVFAGWDVNGDKTADPLEPLSADLVCRAVWREIPREYRITWKFVDDEGECSITETYTYNMVPKYNGTLYAPSGKTFARWDQQIEPVTSDRTYTAVYQKAATGAGVVSASAFHTAPGAVFGTTISICGTDIQNTVLTITFDNKIVDIQEIALADRVVLLEQGDDYITVRIASVEDNRKTPVADLTFVVRETLPLGNHAFLTVTSEDQIESDFQEVEIYGRGDVNCDGKVNIRDLAMLRQYVVGIIELDAAQQTYANVYQDFGDDHAPKVNVRDIGILQQYIVGLIDDIG